MEELFTQQLWGGVKLFFDNVDWLFMVVFMLSTSLINFGVEHPSKFQWLNWLQNTISQTLFVFIWGCLLAAGYSYLEGVKTKPEIAGLIYSILLGMVIWKLGINKIEDYLKSKFGIK